MHELLVLRGGGRRGGGYDVQRLVVVVAPGPRYRPLGGVSCTSPSFCVAFDLADGLASFYTYDGSSWSATGVDQTNNNQLASLSGASSSFCVTVDSVGNALTYNGSSWSSADDIDGANAVNSVSCPTATSCTAVDGNGNVLTYNGSSWSSPQNIDGTNAFDSVSCPTVTFCIAVDDTGNACSFDGSGWSAASDIDGSDQLSSVSCPYASFCAAVDFSGNALTYSAPTPPVVSEVNPATGLTTGGTVVTVTGSGFTDSSVVRFGTTAGTGLHVTSAELLTITSPPGSAGAVDVTVTTANDTSSATPADQFTYTVNQSPTVVNCQPTCSATVNSPDPTTVTASGSSGNNSGTMNIVVNTGTLSCGASYDYETPITTLSTNGFNPGDNLNVVDTVAGVPSASAVKVCYAAGSATTGSFLARCNVLQTNARASSLWSSRPTR